MTKYRVRVWAGPTVPGSAASLSGGRVVRAACARAAACELATAYVEAGMLVDWSAKRTGLRRLGRRWSGRFVPDDRGGSAGVREPRRPEPSSGGTRVAVDPSTA